MHLKSVQVPASGITPEEHIELRSILESACPRQGQGQGLDAITRLIDLATHKVHHSYTCSHTSKQHITCTTQLVHVPDLRVQLHVMSAPCYMSCPNSTYHIKNLPAAKHCSTTFGSWAP